MLDVTDQASVASAAATVAEQLDGRGLSGLINNAGIATAGPLEYLPLDEFRHQLEVNVTGQLAVTQAMLPYLRSASGRIVLMGSIGGRTASPFLGAYNASKFALEALADALRLELQPWNLYVSLIEPGSIATPLWSKSDATARRIAARIPAEAEARYGAALRAMRKSATAIGERGVPADTVAAAVAHALTSARPRTRYLVGRDAKIQARLAPWVPDRLRDRLVTRFLGLPAAGAYVRGSR